MFKNYIENKKHNLDEEYMKIALSQAEESKSRGDIARGACLSLHGSHVAEGNTVLSDHNPLNHEVMNVLKKAESKNLKECILYCTVEPCSMCVSAAHQFGIREIVFGAFDKKDGFLSSPKKIDAESFDVVYIGGVLAESCYAINSPTMRESLYV